SARIFAIIDVYDALRSDRPYRKAWSEGRVREYIRSLSGSHFDPELVGAFNRFLESESAGDLVISIGLQPAESLPVL
ncbi:MAG: hypothetical protein M3014_10705, partial [Chloroflexota bacterium]|nr:hypothetical protein [Chloroflexota bacterium]